MPERPRKARLPKSALELYLLKRRTDRLLDFDRKERHREYARWLLLGLGGGILLMLVCQHFHFPTV